MPLAFALNDQNLVDWLDRRICSSKQHHSTCAPRKMCEWLSALQLSPAVATRSCSAKLGILRARAADKEHLEASRRLMYTEVVSDRSTLGTNNRFDTVVGNTVFSRDQGTGCLNNEKTRKDV